MSRTQQGRLCNATELTFPTAGKSDVGAPRKDGLDWPTSKLGKHVKIYSGVAPSQVKLEETGEYPFVKVEDLNNCSKYQETSRLFTNDKKGFAPANSVIFPKRGAAIMNNKIRIAAVDLTMDTNLMAVSPGDELDTEYFFYAIESEGLFKIADTSTIPQLNNKHINPYEIPIPPLPEQRKIAEILRTWDKAIAKLDALRAAHEGRYCALARRFYDPCHSTYDDRPASFLEYELGDAFVERNQPGSEEDRLLSITMGGGVIDREDVGRKDTSTEDKTKYKLVLPGDIGYNTMRMWQGVSGLSTRRGIVSPAYTVVTPIEGRIVGRYAAHLFKSRRMAFDFQRYSQGLTSDTWNLKFPAFSKIKVFLPSIEVQEEQADILDTMNSEIAAIKRKRDALERQKRGLMQKLLTGEWRVSNKETA